MLLNSNNEFIIKFNDKNINLNKINIIIKNPIYTKKLNNKVFIADLHNDLINMYIFTITDQDYNVCQFEINNIIHIKNIYVLQKRNSNNTDNNDNTDNDYNIYLFDEIQSYKFNIHYLIFCTEKKEILCKSAITLENINNYKIMKFKQQGTDQDCIVITQNDTTILLNDQLKKISID
jgi:hypothetical protein